MKSLSFLIFVVLAFCCWGTYGPTLHIGQRAMGADGQYSSLRPFICVGLAYFLIAVIVPILILVLKGEKGNWSITGFVWSFIAGAIGALGALGITMAFKFRGSPVYVMPLVFGCAPIVNTFVTMAMARTFRQASTIFYVGILVVAIGAAGVLTFKPAANKPHTGLESAPTRSHVTHVAFKQVEAEQGSGVAVKAAATEKTAVSDGSAPASNPNLATRTTNTMLVALSIFCTALCWGSYGPVLHKGQLKMSGSKLRPFLCVGLAYFAIAVVVPYFLLPMFPEPGGWQDSSGRLNPGIWWSMLAGAVGAIGALGIIYAFNFGGKPVFVMPLVFGFAPVVNTLVEAFSKNLLNQIQPMFIASLMMVIIGAVMVLVFAPRSAPHKPAVN